MTPAIFDAIVYDIATHGNSRRAIRDNKGDLKGFYAILAADEEARKRYAHAKDLGLDSLADEIIEIADESREGTRTKETKDGTFSETGDMVDRSRLQVDARKWLLSKLAPKKYGDKLELDAKVNVGDALIERLANGRQRADG